MFVFPQPQIKICDDCGAAVPLRQLDEHACDPERVLDYTMVKLGPEIRNFEIQLGWFLTTPRGRFEQMYAARDRRLGRVTPLHPDTMAVAA